MPRTSANRPWLLSAAIAGVTAAGLLGGCDDANTVDRRVRESIQESRVARMAGDQEKAQQVLERAASEAEAPNATKAHAKALLAQAELDGALALATDPQDGIEAINRDIVRIIREISQLGQQIVQTSSSITAYKALEPIEARKQVQAETAAATGGADKADWVGKPPVAVPTLSAVKQRVAELQDAVAKQQQHIESLQKQQRDVATAAAQAQQKAETLSGKEGVQQFKQASDLRKQAADLANQVEVAQAKLIPLQQDLKLAEVQQAAVTRALEQFQQVGQQVESGWKAIEQQAERQQQLAMAILQGSAGDLKTRESIAQKADLLAKKVKEVTDKYARAEAMLTSAITHYEEAASAATQLASELRPRLTELPSDNAMRQTLDTLMQVYNPVVFTLGQANAQLALGNLQASRAQTMLERHKLGAALGEALQAASLQAPPGLTDTKIAPEAQKLMKSAEELYQQAFENYTTVADSGAADPDKNGGRTGRIYASYGRALLARLAGNANAAKAHLQTAIGARDAVLQEAPTAIAALPAELVVSATTRPTPATAPAPTAPAPTAPAPGASGAPGAEAPAEGAAPAPAEGATPAPAPAEGTPPTPAPAEGAPPAPAEGAAPPAPPDGANPPPQ